MPPKSFAKGVYKKCPNCKKQCPVATRNCPCGHQYFEERRRSTNSTTSITTIDDDIKEIEVVNVSPALAMKTQRGALGNKGLGGNSNGNSASSAIDVKGGAADVGGSHRRSERVKREKPNFYDALEFENKQRKVKIKDDDDDEPIKERKKRKKKKKHGNKEEEEVDEEIMAGITVEKEQQYSIVLADINFRLGLNNPKFIKIS